MIQPVANRLCHSVSPERVEAVRQFGFTDRQARFLTHVLVFSGVFLERQYRAFTGLAHGQKTHDFLTKLVTAGYATSITPGALHRGRLFHLQFKPLYEAIGEPNNRHRRPASLGRFVERLMLLDAVLADRRYGWLGTERDKLAYFREALREYKLKDYFYPHMTFGTGANTTTRFFPDKLPIGVPLHCEHRHVLLYLATRENPMAFRVFLLRHGDVLPHLHEWTMRVLLPRRVRKAAALYRYALRDAFMNRVMPHEAEELDWYFRVRRGEVVCPAPDRHYRIATMAQTYAAGRFEALYRLWLERGYRAFWPVQYGGIRDQLLRGQARIEFAELPHQYLQLTPLVGTTSGVEKGSFQGDDLATP